MAMSNSSYARYNDEAVLTIRQFLRESDRDDLPDLATENLTIAATQWLIDQNDRWSKQYIGLRCLGMAQRLDLMISCDLVEPSSVAEILDSLRKKKIRPVGVGDAVNPNRRRQKEPGLRVRNAGLRKVIEYLAEESDEFGAWLAGYLKISSRIGWRPGEMMDIRLDGRILSASAEKYSRLNPYGADGLNKMGGSGDRGLFQRVEIRIGERYNKKILAALQAWIEGTEKWLKVYDGPQKLLAAMRERIRRACWHEKVKEFSPYATRHFAMASMKRSKRSREEIAAIVNHLSNRTAGENYAEARSGIRRAQSMFSVHPDRVAAVQLKARPFPRRAFAARRNASKRSSEYGWFPAGGAYLAARLPMSRLSSGEIFRHGFPAFGLRVVKARKRGSSRLDARNDYAD